MGAQQCCTKPQKTQEEIDQRKMEINGDEILDKNGKKSKKKYDYEDWHPSWQYDEPDGEETTEKSDKNISDTPGNNETPGNTNKKISENQKPKEVLFKDLNNKVKSPENKPKIQEKVEVKFKKLGPEESEAIKIEEIKPKNMPEKIQMKNEEIDTIKNPKTENNKKQAKIATPEKISEKVEKIIEPIKFEKPQEKLPKPQHVIKPIQKEEIKKAEPKSILKKKQPEPKKSPLAYLTSVSNHDFTDLQKNLKLELMKAKLSSKLQSGSNALPFFMSGSPYMDNYTLIFSRDIRGLNFVFSESDSVDTFMGKYTIKTIQLNYLDPENVIKKISGYLSGVKLTLVGIINDRQNPSFLHFVFVNHSQNETKYGCAVLQGKKFPEIEEELNKMGEQGKYGKYFFAVYNKNFTQISSRYVVYEIIEGLQKKYKVSDFPDYDFFNTEIAKFEKVGEEFVGASLGLGFEDSFILFLS